MSQSFSQLLAEVRSGDAEAAEVLVKRFEASVRIAVRARLSDVRLRRLFDSQDVCQSVLASFFLQVAAGAYELNEPQQLTALLVKMAQNKLAQRTRNHFRKCRDFRRQTETDSNEIPSHGPDPLRRLAGQDLLHRALAMMSPEIRAVADRRIVGHPWAQIADELGGSAESRRKQYERAIDRIADALDIDTVEV